MTDKQTSREPKKKKNGMRSKGMKGTANDRAFFGVLISNYQRKTKTSRTSIEFEIGKYKSRNTERTINSKEIMVKTAHKTLRATASPNGKANRPGNIALQQPIPLPVRERESLKF